MFHRKQGGREAMRRSSDERKGGFWTVRHTYSAHAEARRFRAEWNAASGAIKDADPARLLP